MLHVEVTDEGGIAIVAGPDEALELHGALLLNPQYREGDRPTVDAILTFIEQARASAQVIA